ncbi:Gfo/Idh/MocA family protein [Asanoa iriomotensis]|uniref:Oxidoreductase n=1 Tax=Asanoa iriomotensis TaxID=234613 RepID=A0ABQ4C1B7_9ACTN|nr:Gfo/Idh/MocA family oxidoreductase [Asanoa iriomotensis]GIF56578.1 oxidoreductase [Asanoa iriomotensis]
MRIGLVGVGRIGSFHARTLSSLDAVDLVITDADQAAARALGAELSVPVAEDTATLIGRVDALVIAAATPAHATLLAAGVAAGLPTFCEKPVAATLHETLELMALVERSGVPVQIGFQRRFDAGYRRVRAAIECGELGFVHTIRANTHDQTPPPAAYIATSGGIFRDCSVHDFDIVRFVTGCEVSTVYATGANKGAPFFTAAGDVDTGGALLTLDDGTIVLVSATRYNGAGHDVRLEVLGEKGALGVGLDHSLALDSAEPVDAWPAGPRHQSFMDRFRPAYEAELAAFVDVARGARPSPCTVRDALAAFRVAEACELSRAAHQPIALVEIKGA